MGWPSFISRIGFWKRRGGEARAISGLHTSGVAQTRTLFTGEHISAICLGMDKMYPGAREADFIANVHYALDQGVNLIDTAAIYGNGSNEDLVGRALKGRRHEAFICTKFGHLVGPDHQPAGGGRPENVFAECERSLKNLQTDVIDLYLQHIPDPTTPIEETAGALSRLVEQGKIRYMGLSNMPVEAMRRAQAVHPQAAVQIEYSLWHRWPEIEMLPACRDLGVVAMAYWPLSSGFLAGKIRSVPDLEKPEFRALVLRGNLAADRLAADLDKLSALEQVATSHACTPAQAALAWMIGGEFSAIPVFGTQAHTHVIENIAVVGLVLPDDARKLLDAAYAIPR